jgi:hypothetical protein
MIVSGDVYLVIKSMKQVGWKSIRGTSINRILYMSSVVYSFRFPNVKNIFEDNYHFSITISGPEETLVQNALINLESNELIEHGDEGYYLVQLNHQNPYEDLPSYEAKKIWIEDMAYIIGIYGEDKMYDFIFRDPEYKFSLRANKEYSLDIGPDNETIKFLNSFKKDFENNLKDTPYKIDNRKYLELYFEYIFGRILRGE